MVVKSKDFNELLLASIDEALLSMGVSTRQSIYFHIENNFSLFRDEIPQNLERFQFALEKIFGLGSRFLEILIMKSLYAKLEKPLNMDIREDLEFIKYVDTAKKNFVTTCKINAKRATF